MIKKAVVIAAAVASVAAAAGVCVVALAYALFALSRDYLNPAGSAAVVAGAFAVVLLIVGLVLMFKDKGFRLKPAPEPTLVETATAFVRERPILSLVAVLAGSVVAVRNPALVATLVMGMLAPKPGNKR